jgi:hypothetical protein
MEYFSTDASCTRFISCTFIFLMFFDDFTLKLFDFDGTGLLASMALSTFDFFNCGTVNSSSATASCLIEFAFDAPCSLSTLECVERSYKHLKSKEVGQLQANTPAVLSDVAHLPFCVPAPQSVSAPTVRQPHGRRRQSALREPSTVVRRRVHVRSARRSGPDR